MMSFILTIGRAQPTRPCRAFCHLAAGARQGHGHARLRRMAGAAAADPDHGVAQRHRRKFRQAGRLHRGRRLRRRPPHDAAPAHRANHPLPGHPATARCRRRRSPSPSRRSADPSAGGRGSNRRPPPSPAPRAPSAGPARRRNNHPASAAATPAAAARSGPMQAGALPRPYCSVMGTNVRLPVRARSPSSAAAGAAAAWTTPKKSPKAHERS